MVGSNKYRISVDLNEQMLGFLYSRLRGQMQSSNSTSKKACEKRYNDTGKYKKKRPR